MTRMRGDATVPAGPELVRLERGGLSPQIQLRPFAVTLRRAGRRLLRDGGLWVADGSSSDHFIQLTEGVIPNEQLTPVERAQRAELRNQSEHELEFAILLSGGREATLVIANPAD